MSSPTMLGDILLIRWCVIKPLARIDKKPSYGLLRFAGIDDDAYIQ